MVMAQTHKVLVHTARGERHDPIGGQVVKVRLEIPDLHHDYVGRPRVQLYPLKLFQGRVLIAPSRHDDAKPPRFPALPYAGRQDRQLGSAPGHSGG